MGPPIAFCVTSFHRTWQLLTVLAHNVCMTWPFRRTITWVIVDLNPSEDLEIANYLGEFCRAAVLSEHVQLFKVSPEGPTFDFWHASIAKNTSHCAAAHLGDNTILVNVDGDNFVTPGFCRDIIQNSIGMQSTSGVPLVDLPQGGSQKLPFCVCARYSRPGPGGGTTGRICIALPVFRALKGYDEDLGPSGYQDVDLYIRARSIGLARHISFDETGDVVMNVAQDTKVQFNASCAAKVKHVDPTVLARYGGSWSKMNQICVKAAKNKMTQGQVIRNARAVSLGVPVVRVAYVDTELPDDAMDVDDEEILPPPPATSGVTLVGSNLAYDPTAAVTPRPPSSPPPRPRKFHMVTFGAEKLLGSFTHSQAAGAMKATVLGKRHGAPLPISEEVVRNAMRECKQPNPMVIQDARCFIDFDMQVRSDTKGHTGEHPLVIARLVRHRDFKTVLARFVDAVVAHEKGGRVEDFTCCVFCRAGEIRSVALARILCTILRRMHEWDCASERHLSAWYWQYKTCGANNCRTCCEPNDVKEASFVYAQTVWRDLILERGWHCAEVWRVPPGGGGGAASSSHGP